jgi:hypothetical protein
MSIETAVRQYLSGKAPNGDYEWDEHLIANNLPIDRHAHWVMLTEAYGAGACLAEIKRQCPPRWTCRGSVRGDCGIMHRTREAADKCCERDMRACNKQGGYSDRFVTEVRKIRSNGG